MIYTTMAKIATLADARREGFDIRAHRLKEHCGRGRRLDIDALIRRFGGNHWIINETEITRRLRFECGQKGAALHFRPTNKSGVAMPAASAS